MRPSPVGGSQPYASVRGGLAPCDGGAGGPCV